MDIQGALGLGDALFFLTVLTSWNFGPLLLIADVVAGTYVLSAGAAARRLYWVMFAGVVLANLMMMLFGQGLWRQAMTGAPRTYGVPINALNVVSPWALLVFVLAPGLKSWRRRRSARVT